MQTSQTLELWFDVGFKRYTTLNLLITLQGWLWFDVGFKRYTTLHSKIRI